MNYLNLFKKVSFNDLKTSNGIYYLNSNVKFSSNMKKLINLKMLQYKILNLVPRFCIEHNNSRLSEVSDTFLNQFSIYNYINLPNSVFFESNGTYLNTQGFFKQTIKFITNEKQNKEDWQIIRKLFYNFRKVNFLNNRKSNKLISFNMITINNYKKFIQLLYFANNNFNFKTKLLGNFNTVKIDIKSSTKKFYLTNTKNWLKDFYIGGSDLYSMYSTTMITCSKNYRTDSHNFISY